MSERYDVVVIGGGIHGVGVAQAAAVRGHRTLLLEQEALAACTSSRSSKLIHGGLRYLESGQIRLVRESLREREILLAIAPGLVKRKAFYIPIYKGARRTSAYVGAGLLLYRLFAPGKSGAFERLAASSWDTLDGLNTTNLQAVYRYEDAQTDDVALTQAVARSAQEFGADIQLGASFIGAERAGQGYELRYLRSGQVTSCKTRALVNATGPWVGQVLSRIVPGPPRLPYDLVLGTHILTEGSLRQGLYYVEALADGRGVFVMPWQGRILTGTTESAYTGDPRAVSGTPADIAYLQETLAHYFPALSLTVQASFAGVRVLPRSHAAFSARPREVVLLADQPVPHLVSIFGGKLTGYRRTAERVLERLKAVLPERVAKADTSRLKLPYP